jgi:predicted GNAT family acetyltransferase
VRQFHPAFSFYADEARCQTLVAEDGSGRIRGTAVAFQHGDVGWIGNVFVSPELRGQGLGARLTRAVIEYLGERGCTTIPLSTSQLGEPLYRGLGFRVETEYHEFQGAGLSRLNSLPGGARPLFGSDLDDVLRLDYELAGEDRTCLIRRFWPQGWALTDAGSAIVGIVIPVPWGGVSTWLCPAAFAEQEDSLLTLIRSVIGPCSELLLCPTTENVAARRLLSAAGFVELRIVPRMVFGIGRRWEAASLWSPFNLAMG